jgi:menaquinone-dependent protoporphyrinogen oxidase
MVVLVVYATKYGATRSVAQRIAAQLRTHGHQVVTHTADTLTDASIYDAVVVGSAVYKRAWMPDAVSFVRRNLDALAGRPVWVFSVGGLKHPGRWGRLGAKQFPNRIPGFRGYVEPRDYHYFSGEFYRERIGALAALIWRLSGGGFGDFRNWDDMDQWAAGIAADLRAFARHGFLAPSVTSTT